MQRVKKDRPASIWTEEELIDGRRVLAFAVVLRTSGCSWWKRTGGCTMCGYNASSSYPDITGEDIIQQFESAWQSFSSHSIVKIYTSGSFLDDAEIPVKAQDAILTKAGEAGVKLLFESRPEFVNEKIMSHCIKLCGDVELAIGLESANDRIREVSIRKGFSYGDYVHASEAAIDQGAKIRTYLLLKPPYLTEEESISDAVSSIEQAAKYSRVISINPVNVQKRTVVDRLYRKGAFRPPWLWSIIQVLKNADAGDGMLISSLVGAGSSRGPHNCGLCDQDAIQAIEAFNLTQDKSRLDASSCECKERWEINLTVEKFAISAGDHESYFSGIP